MTDGIYQSLICFFMPYLLFAPSQVVTGNGLNVNDRGRMGVYIANATIIVVNVYVVLNTFRWDWLMILLTVISILLIWTWTGIYTSFTASQFFYKAGAECYGSLSFWTVTLLTVILCLLPRFTAKAFQKIFLPRDIDIIREQIRQGKFKYLDDATPVGSSKNSSASSSDIGKPHNVNGTTTRTELDDDRRPIYPPSVAQTATTRNNRSTNGSDGTDYTGHNRSSYDQVRLSQDAVGPLSAARPPLVSRISSDRPRPSFDRMRQSLDMLRPSYENSNDFTSAAMLTRVESSHSDGLGREPANPGGYFARKKLSMKKSRLRNNTGASDR
jgi:phospholipid-translocating ATPase